MKRSGEVDEPYVVVVMRSCRRAQDRLSWLESDREVCDRFELTMICRYPQRRRQAGVDRLLPLYLEAPVL